MMIEALLRKRPYKYLKLLGIIVLLVSKVAAQQLPVKCDEVLSRAEENYRNGKFALVKNDLRYCYNLLKKKDKLSPRRYALTISELQGIEENSRFPLYEWSGFSEEMANSAQSTKKNEDYFNYFERIRANNLIGKTYYQLGNIEASQLFFRLAIKEASNYQELDTDDQGMQALYRQEQKKQIRFSMGLTIGWDYAAPIFKTNHRNSEIVYENLVSSAGILFGLHASYAFNNKWTLNTGFWDMHTNISYSERDTGSDDNFNFLVEENFVWFKIPLLVKWNSPYIFGKNDDVKGSLYLQSGFSINYLYRSRTTVVEPSQEVNLVRVNTIGSKNRINYEWILGGGIDFHLSRSYFSLGLNMSISLLPISNTEEINSDFSYTFREYNVTENNYHTFTGFWEIKYGRYFSFMRKK